MCDSFSAYRGTNLSLAETLGRYELLCRHSLAALLPANAMHGAWAHAKVSLYSTPSVAAERGPIQRSRSAAHPPAMGPFNAIGSDGAWAHAKVSLASFPTSYGPIQSHR
jgi:hypothetical protein